MNLTDLATALDAVRPTVQRREHAAARTDELMPVTAAADRLGVDDIDRLVADLVRAGWAVVPHAGKPFLFADDVDVLAMVTGADEHPIDGGAAEAAVRVALGTLLSRPARGRWAEAVDRRAPLVCARRGAAEHHSDHGITHHRVVIKSSWLFSVAADMVDDHGPLSQAVRRWLPGGRYSLHGFVLDTPGIGPASSATPLFEPGKVHRLDDWACVDPLAWAVGLAPDVAEAVAG